MPQAFDRTVIFHDYPGESKRLGRTLATFDLLTNAYRHICAQYAGSLTRAEAQSNLDCRIILLNAREAAIAGESRPYVGDLIDSLVSTVERVEKKN